MGFSMLLWANSPPRKDTPPVYDWASRLREDRIIAAPDPVQFRATP
jgi:hypothetical protein